MAASLATSIPERRHLTDGITRLATDGFATRGLGQG
jgi:hypothetical protein